MSSAQVRDRLVSALRLDLVGPEPGSAHEREVLPQAPSRWYLTGFLVPYEAPAPQRVDETATEQLELGAAREGADDDTPPEPASARRVYFPSGSCRRA